LITEKIAKEDAKMTPGTQMQLTTLKTKIKKLTTAYRLQTILSCYSPKGKCDEKFKSFKKKSFT
jgi:hypothetical protein